jgi:hypothetical protein
MNEKHYLIMRYRVLHDDLKYTVHFILLFHSFLFNNNRYG